MKTREDAWPYNTWTLAKCLDTLAEMLREIRSGERVADDEEPLRVLGRIRQILFSDPELGA